MSRQDVNRREDRRADRGDDSRAAARSGEVPRRPQLNNYWIDGKGINRQVLQAEIAKFLGAEATCRPGPHPDDVSYLARPCVDSD